MKWMLPPKREFNWKMKTMDSARTEFVVDDDGVFRLKIEHNLLKNISPQMLHWWFEHIGGNMVYKGKEYPKYLVWHPYDHIHWALAKPSPKGKATQGSYFRIVEAFGGDMDCLVDSVEFVEKLDVTGIRLTRKIAGTEIFSLQHDFIPMPGGTQYVSHMVVGTDKPLMGAVFNNWVRPHLFNNEMGHAWLKHNIEEVGNFEFFLPELYEDCVINKTSVLCGE